MKGVLSYQTTGPSFHLILFQRLCKETLQSQLIDDAADYWSLIRINELKQTCNSGTLNIVVIG